MRRLIVTLTTLLAIFGGMAAAPNAQASGSCTVHSLDINVWSEQDRLVGYAASFKCGNGVQSNYKVRVTLQQDVGGWITASCQAGPCTTVKPSSGSFSYGDTHNWNGEWNVANSIAGQDFRIHATVIFNNGDPNVIYNSNRQTL